MATQVCSIPGCEGKVSHQRYCWKHYLRLRRHGSPTAGRIENGAASKFLIGTVLTHTSDECLPWPYGKYSSGYGTIVWDGRARTVHSVVCEITQGPRPSEKHNALHRCGRGKDGCVNWKHLYWGTQKDNTADAIRHGTAVFPTPPAVGVRGEKHVRAILTRKEVRKIRQMYSKYSQRDLAKMFGVSRAAIRSIMSGESWGWLK